MEIKRVLLSVYNKTGLVEFAQGLVQLGVEIISTGGTARTLQEAGIKVIPVQEVTSSPELMDGRVKSLHPRIHGGILARRDMPRHLEELREQDITPIDMVVVNLYPFVEATSDPNCTLESGLENIDIGGPAMLRAAAKNFPGVIPICDPQDYPQVLESLKTKGDLEEVQRKQLAVKAYAHTASYDTAVTAWLQDSSRLSINMTESKALRYGENPHQGAALYLDPKNPQGLAWAQPLQGKELSYNNLNDADAAFNLVAEFEQPAAVAVKHAVPCGVGLGETLAQAFARAKEADPISIFGGIIAVNRPVDQETAELLKEIFLEVVIAPEFTHEAREVLAKKKNLRLIQCKPHLTTGTMLKTISGGVLVQEADTGTSGEWKVAGQVQPPTDWQDTAKLAWFTAKHAKSNAIVICKDGMTLGIGSGCTSRVDAAKIAAQAAGDRATGGIMASDGFIPFPDVVEVAAQAGVKVIVQPGGSKGDEAAIAEADKHGIAMIFTGIRHFKH